MEEGKKFIEEIENVIALAKDTNNNILRLSEGIDGLSSSVKELKKLETLNLSLNELNNNINLLDSCNQKLNSAFENVEKFSNLEQSITNTKTTFSNIERKLSNINTTVENLMNLKSDINVEELSNKILTLSSEFGKLNNYISEEIIKKIEVDLTSSINSLKVEIIALKESFNEYKNNSDKYINELNNENKNIKEYFEKILETNKTIINFFNLMNSSNQNTEKYIQSVMEKWYRDNVTIFGIKKNKKGE